MWLAFILKATAEVVASSLSPSLNVQDFNTPAREPPATVDLDFKANRITPKHLPTMDVKLLLPLAAALAVLTYAPPSEGKKLKICIMLRALGLFMGYLYVMCTFSLVCLFFFSSTAT